MQFDDYVSDFYHYMVTEGELAKKTSHDYISRLKFLSTNYVIDETLTGEMVRYILSEEEKNRKMRSVYSSRKAISDFSAGLYKFLAFVNSDYNKRLQDSIIKEIEHIEKSNAIQETEKRSLVLSRVGQGRFRNDLINYWGCCAVTGFASTWMLVASHIKPWRDSNNKERLDVYNGLLLLPNIDKLFDKGYISFNQSGHVIYSNLLSKEDKKILSMHDDMKLIRVESCHIPYLRYHNDHYLL